MRPPSVAVDVYFCLGVLLAADLNSRQAQVSTHTRQLRVLPQVTTGLDAIQVVDRNTLAEAYTVHCMMMCNG